MQLKPITETIVISDQPSAEDLETLPRDGYAGVVNLRNDGEPEQPLDTATEGQRVRALGMDYLHYGVGGKPLEPDGVTGVLDFLNRHAGEKVLVHCRKGSRAAALVLLHQARAQGWSPAEALTRGEAMGLKVDGKLREMVEQYLADHPTTG